MITQIDNETAWLFKRGGELMKGAGFHKKQLFSKKRNQTVAHIRGAMMYQLRWRYGWTLADTGAAFNRTYCTAFYWCEKISDLEYIEDKETMRYLRYLLN